MNESRQTINSYQSGPNEKYHCGLEKPLGFLSQADSTRSKKYPRFIFTPIPDVITHGENVPILFDPYLLGHVLEENSSEVSHAAPKSINT